MTGARFVNRVAELSALAEEAARACRGDPRIVQVSGPAGVGKSALVNAFLAGHPELARAVVAGAEAEAGVHLGVADALLHAVGAGAGQRDIAAGPLTANPLAHGAALVGYLTRAQRVNGALALVVDEFDWADQASVTALTFAFRRLHTEPILAILIGREEPQPGTPLGRIIDGPRGRRITVAGLGVGAVKEIASGLISRTVSTADARSLHAHTGGNPLYLKALLAELSAHDAIDERRLPAPKSFSGTALAPLTRSPAPTRRLVAAAAVFGIEARVADAAWVAAIGTPLEAAEAAPPSLVRLSDGPAGWTLRFTHPLNRAAVYHNLPVSERARLHGLAAARTAGRPALWHRVRATDRPDSALAADLAAAAAQQAAAGEFGTAADDLSGAAHVHPDLATRHRLLLDAADHRLWAGDPGGAEALLGMFDGAFDDAFDARWRYVRGHLAAVAGRFPEGQAGLEAAWNRLGTQDDDLRGPIASLLAQLTILRCQGSTAARWAAQALESLAPGHHLTSITRGYLGLALWMCGRPQEAVASMTGLPADPASVSPDDAAQLAVRGVLRCWGDDLAAGRADCAQAIRLGRANGVPVYVFLAEAEYWTGDWNDSAAHAGLAVSVAEDTDQPWFTALAHSVATLVPAGRGQWSAAQAHATASAASAARLGVEAGRVFAANAAVSLAFARQDWAGVVAAAAPLYRLEFRDGAFEPGDFPWRERYQEALIAVGRERDARRDVAEFLELATARGRRSALARLSRPQAALAQAAGDLSGARGVLEAGIEHAETAGPFDQALVHEALGRLLRRQGERRRAAEHLQAALDRYERLGAAPFRDRCASEISACGLHPVRRTRASRALVLTARERTVAELAVRGLTNRQISAELCVSVKTVEYHLSAVFAKLGVSSRTQLAARFAGHRED